MAKKMYQPRDEEEKYRQLREQARAEGSDIFRTRRGNSTLYVLEGENTGIVFDSLDEVENYLFRELIISPRRVQKFTRKLALEGAGWFSVSTTDWKETRCYKADLKTGYFDADRYSDTARFYLDNGLLEVD